MATNSATPFWDSGDTITAHAAAPLYGKRFVAIAGPRTEGNPTVNYPAAGGAKVFGVTGYDVAAGAKVTVHHAPPIVVPVTAGAAVAAGDLVTSDATGRAVPAGTGQQILGLALDAAALGEDVCLDRTIRG